MRKKIDGKTLTIKSDPILEEIEAEVLESLTDEEHKNKSVEERRFKPVPPEKKGEVIALLMEGIGAIEIRKRTGLSFSYIYKVKDAWETENYIGAVIDIKKNLGNYIADSLRKHMSAMNKIAEVALDEQYIRQQSGSNLAALHARLENWTLSILQASNGIDRANEIAGPEVFRTIEPKE
jgi:hypothetical protein